MRSVRTCRYGTVAAVVAWKLAALALLPVALCCQAMMSADRAALIACSCEGGVHGAVCPMKRAARADHDGDHGDADAQANGPRIIGCNSLDDALVGLFGLTGFTPDAFEWAAGPEPRERITEARYAAASAADAPSPPPPRRS